MLWIECKEVVKKKEHRRLIELIEVRERRIFHEMVEKNEHNDFHERWKKMDAMISSKKKYERRNDCYEFNEMVYNRD